MSNPAPDGDRAQRGGGRALAAGLLAVTAVAVGEVVVVGAAWLA